MTIDELIPTVLERIAGLEHDVYPGEALKTAGERFVIYLQNTQSEEDALDGPTGLLSASFEVNAVAKTYAAMVVLAAQVQGALRSMQGKTYDNLLVERVTLRASPDLKETEVGLWRRLYMADIKYQID